MNGKQISHRQIPFGPKEDGGATHGMSWQEDVHKIWIDSNRVGTIMRIDPKTWEVDWMFPMTRIVQRLHGIAYDNGFIWQVCGTQKPGTSDYAGYTPGLLKYRHQDWTGCRAGGLRPGLGRYSRCDGQQGAPLRRRCRRASGLVNRCSRYTSTKDTRRSTARPAARSSRSI